MVRTPQNKIGAPKFDKVKNTPLMSISEMDANKEEHTQEPKMQNEDPTETKKEKLSENPKVSEILNDYKQEKIINMSNTAIKLAEDDDGLMGKLAIADGYGLIQKNATEPKKETQPKKEAKKEPQPKKDTKEAKKETKKPIVEAKEPKEKVEKNKNLSVEEEYKNLMSQEAQLKKDQEELASIEEKNSEMKKAEKLSEKFRKIQKEQNEEEAHKKE